MKTLYVVRHAKSSWLNVGTADFDRPLNDRGLRDAPEMVRRVLKRRRDIDLFVSSPAKRAAETCKIFCEAYEVDASKILYIDALYHASATTMYEVVRAFSDRYHNIAMFSHNPGITDFVDSLCENVRVDNMPTCGVFAVEADIKSWSQFKAHKNEYIFFDYPKAK